MEDKEIQRMSREYGWGFTIYRTVYTEQSDQQWATVLSRLDRYVAWEVDACVSRDVLAEVMEAYHNTVIQDRELFDGASIDDLREHFRNHLPVPEREDGGSLTGNRRDLSQLENPPKDWNLMPMQNGVIVTWRARDRCFIVLDQDSLDSIMSAPSDPIETTTLAWQEMKALQQKFRVTMTDALHCPGKAPPGPARKGPPRRPGVPKPPYPGWIYVSLFCIWRYSFDMHLMDDHNMEQSVPTQDSAWVEQ